LNKAWELVLGGQFHDLLAGTCLPVAYDFSWNDEVLAMNQFAGVLQNATGGIASAMDTRARGVSLVIYNPLSIGRQDVVQATVALPANTRAVRVVGPDGAVAPSQVLGPDGKGIKILFVASVPAVGFASFDVEPSRAPEPADAALKVTNNSIENARYKITLDENGDIASIFDKTANRQMLSAPARLAFQYENPSQYPSWNMDWDDQSKPPRAYVTGPATFRIVENGPVQVALEISRKSQGSVFVQTIRLSAGDAGNRIEIANHIDWHTGETALKAVFPLSVSNPMATYNWEVGTIQRGNNDPKKYEVPSHQWFDLTDTSGKYGVTVLSDCKNGSDKPDDNTLRLTLLYSPGTRGGYQDQAEQDWGQHDFVYGLVGHTGDWRQGRTNWQALRLSQPLIAFQSPSHPGGLGKTFSLVSLNNPAVRILALKKAEDSDEIIVRLVELDGKPATNVHVHFAVPLAAAREVNGQEQPVGPATVTGGDLVTDLTGYQLRTFAVRLGAPPVTVPAAQTQTVTLPYNLCATSSDDQKSNGGFDVAGQAIPAAMLPQAISYGDVPFEFGPITGGKPNAVICQGQRIELPAGKFSHLYILAASADKDLPAAFKVDGRSTTVDVQQWGGYIGQWDQRYFLGKIPELSYDWPNKFGGLLPGYIKRQPVAWFSPFRHTAAGQDEPYSYAYMFAYKIPVRAGARTLTLPDAPDVRVMAATMADDPEGDVEAAAPLYDVIDRKTGMAPDLSPAAGTYDDTTTVTFKQELYGTADSYHYTTDGSIPTAASPTYTSPLTLTKNTDLKARMITPTGITGPVVVADYRIHDTTPPHILAATASTLTPDARVVFSEPVDPATAGNGANYLMNGGPAVKAASLLPDGRTVLLTLAGPPAPMAKMSVQVTGVKDVSPAGNMIRQAITQNVTMEGPVAQLAEATLDGKGGGSKSVQIDNQAVASGSSDWTINFWLWVDAEPSPYTLIAGFGSGRDASGQQRYLSVFPNGLHFWGGNIDIDAGGTLDTGKWQMLSATYDGTNVHIYKNGKDVGSGAASFSDAQPVMKVAPRAPWPDHGGRLAGKIRDLTVWDRTLTPASLTFLATQAPN
jgi:alpha-mannosidase